ncbi:MAG: DUF432 domain-containing protein [Methanolinea sp.]|nr:DUF432 domain-containing protein [Methanolinea sp.]
MFGIHKYPFEYREREVFLSIEPGDRYSHYHRVIPGNDCRKMIGNLEGRVVINPVEPVSLPHDVTGMIEFHFTPIVLEPGSTVKIYLKFPVEIGVFLESTDGYDVLDVFTLAKQKFSLYGTPEKGFITRHIEAGVFDTIPGTDSLTEGVMEIAMHNCGQAWVEVSRAVFEQSTMHLFYGSMVSMKAEMEVHSRQMAVTRVLERPLEAEMKQSVRLFSARRILIPEKPVFIMEYGVGDT